MSADLVLLARRHWTGTLLLIAATGGVFASGLVLQLLAIRWLDGAEYARFVLAIGLGNAAGMVAAIVSPVVAEQAANGRARPLPASPRVVALWGIGAGGVLVALLGFSTDPGLAALAVLQVPLVFAIAVGTGGLQGEIRVSATALSTTVWAATRLGIAVGLALAIVRDDRMFVLGLVLALACQVATLRALGAFRRIEWVPNVDVRGLLRQYATWLTFGWIVNADVIVAPLLLPDGAAGDYALALTLGRQAIYLVAPVAFVLLPISWSRPPWQQRSLLLGVCALGAAVTVAMVLVLTPAPGAVVELLRPDEPLADSMLVRLYALIGGVGAFATLLFVLGAGTRSMPSLRALFAFGLTLGVALVLIGRDSRGLAVTQLLALATIAAWLWRLDWRATSPSPR
ncbi:MAG: hypothetical protein R3C39_14955 [Dehalococcoidia bacterium]